MARTATQSLFTAELIVPAIRDAFKKLNPKELIRNPVMFTTAVVAVLLTVLLVVGQDGDSPLAGLRFLDVGLVDKLDALVFEQDKKLIEIFGIERIVGQVVV